MGWQRTFTLGRRSKGAHLITDEVVRNIQPGIQDVQIGMLYLFVYAISPTRCHNLMRWSPVSIHLVPWLWTKTMIKVWISVCVMNLRTAVTDELIRCSDVRKGNELRQMRVLSHIYRLFQTWIWLSIMLCRNPWTGFTLTKDQSMLFSFLLLYFKTLTRVRSD